ncbi:MAG: PAS domain S-box protein, partial [Candidatus Omnitrophota bacterium]
DVILPTFSISAIPDIADLFGLIWAFGIVYSIARYRFLAMTPSTAADSIISTMTDCLVLLNRECGIVTVNRAVLDLLHYAKNDLEGARAEKLFEDNQENKDLLKKIEKGEGVRNRDIFLRTKHGKDIPVIFSSSVLWDGDGNIVGTVCIANDITDRKKWEEELRHAHSKLEARVKERTADLMTANERLQREVAERKRIETSLRESQEKYSTLIEKGNDAIIIVQDGVVKFANSKMREFTGISVEKVIGRPFVDFISPAFRKLTYDMYSQRVSRKDVPARYEIKVLSKDGKEIPVEISASLIEYEGKIASMGIIRDMTERKSTEEELKRSYKQLEKIIESIIYAMARIVEVRDPYTAGHQQRVAVLACAIAKEMGMEDDRIKGIHMAAVIHDIGKISIPGEILSKPGRLSKLEFGIIQAHSQMGYDVLKSIDFPWPIAQMILQHHERRDGSGYPSGMHQKNILLEAEIISVADVVEAMTSHRPYRPALGPEKALQEISQRKGEIYHPDHLDACLKLFREKGFKFEA